MTFPFRLNDGRVIPLAGMEYLAPLLEYAAAAQANAEAAAALAVAAATSLPNVYSSTALGLAAVAEDGTFWVSSSDGLALYRDDGGSATLLYTMFEALAYKPTDPDLVGSIAIGNGLRNLFHTTADTGQANIAIGQDAGRDLGSGRLNILIGYTTGRNMTDLDVVNGYAGVNGNAGNVLIGGYSGSVANGAYDNTGVGTQCMLNLTGGMDNAALGINALKNVEGGSENAAFGHAALEFLVGSGDFPTGNGHRNTAIGDMAGRFLNDLVTGKTTGKANTYLGAHSTSGDNDSVNEMVIGYQARGEGSNTTVIGNVDVSRTYIFGDVALGQVALGDTSVPAARLHIFTPTSTALTEDGVRVSQPGEVGNFAFASFDATGDRAVFGAVVPGAGAQIGLVVSDGTTEVEAVRIDQEGRVGIGTDTPTEVLTVDGNAAISGNLSVAGVDEIEEVPNAVLDPMTGLLGRSTLFTRASAMPTTGSYVQGAFVWNAMPAIVDGSVLLGWTRLNTGSGHVLNDDWAALYVPTLAVPVYLQESEALFARMTSTPTPARKALINSLIAALMDAGVWDRLDALWVMAAADSQAGALNWLEDDYDLSPVGSPMFTADRGYQSDGTTSYLDSGLMPGTGLVQQDNHHISVWSLTAAADMAGEIGTADLAINTRTTSDQLITRSANNSGDSTSNADGDGLFTVSRDNSATYDRYRQDTSLGVASQGSAAFAAQTIFICGRNGGGSPSSLSTAQLAVASAGASMTSTQVQAFHAALEAYLEGVGAI